jgi:hypothetical protein
VRGNRRLTASLDVGAASLGPSGPSMPGDWGRSESYAQRGDMDQQSAAYSISKIEYRTMFGGSLSPTPTARMLFSQA